MPGEGDCGEPGQAEQVGLCITVVPPALSTIQEYFKHTLHLLPNREEGNLWLEVESHRKAYYGWVTQVREVSICE